VGWLTEVLRSGDRIITLVLRDRNDGNGTLDLVYG